MPYIAVVTGGTRGIGAAISIELKQKGYLVIANYVGHDEEAEKFSQEHEIPVRKWDVSHYKSCQNHLEHISQTYGSVDILVNNAGITRDGFLHKTTPKMWEDVISIDLSSCYNMSHCVIEGMYKKKFGRIINISSINGQKGQSGQVNYSAAKAGIIGFTKALALEGASKGITVNAIAPGYIDTDMVRAVSEPILNSIISQNPMKRLGKPEEVAYVVSFLADERASFINGATISVNGGQYTG